VEHLPGREDGWNCEVGTTHHHVVVLVTSWHAECSLAAPQDRWFRPWCSGCHGLLEALAVGKGVVAAIIIGPRFTFAHQGTPRA